MNDVSTARDIMTIEWKDPNMRLHGKRHKNDRYYFRWHYGKQRRVYMYKEYVDKPTDRQVSAREAFTALRKEVARQLRDADLRAEWMRRFEADNEGYKFLHTYVYAKIKAPSDSPIEGESAEQKDTGRDGIHAVSQSTIEAIHETACMPSLQVSTTKTPQETHIKGVSTSTAPILVLWNGVIVPIFLPACVPKITCLQI